MLFEWEETDKAKTVKSTSCYFSRKGYSEDTAINKIWEWYYCSDYRNYSDMWTDKSSITSPLNITIRLRKKIPKALFSISKEVYKAEWLRTGKCFLRSEESFGTHSATSLQIKPLCCSCPRLCTQSLTQHVASGCLLNACPATEQILLCSSL